MRYEDIWCSNEYADTPEWVEVSLSEKDKARIPVARAFLKEHDGDQVRFELNGTFDWSADFNGKVRIWQLIVTSYRVWVEFTEEWSGTIYEIQLDDEELV